MIKIGTNWYQGYNLKYSTVIRIQNEAKLKCVKKNILVAIELIRLVTENACIWAHVFHIHIFGCTWSIYMHQKASAYKQAFTILVLKIVLNRTIWYFCCEKLLWYILIKRRPIASRIYEWFEDSKFVAQLCTIIKPDLIRGARDPRFDLY